MQAVYMIEKQSHASLSASVMLETTCLTQFTTIYINNGEKKS